MKKIIFNLFFFLFLISLVNAQTEQNVEKNYQTEEDVDEKYRDICDGLLCLRQENFSSEGITEYQFGLMRKKTHYFYLFKEEGKVFPNMNIYDYQGNHITDFETFYFENENYMYIKYKSPYHKLFKVKLQFSENESANASVVLSINSPNVIINRIHQPNAQK